MNETNRNNLEREFTKEEILESLDECNGDKAPGLDDFDMKFLQEFWHIIKSDRVEVFSDLHKLDSFVKIFKLHFLGAYC